eukprot:CAMPEP_0178762650 /NCGR_PEP_ID=MMETSP0744-20121128/16659_1 /TAXON_ID=913974 /ORGANISM="Nitzschia punctata, Strain CCMP561" /LENGTH=393 /DNA_ID=CAMNT_0020417349 /DNA_START=616 /DNA_END=1797 /DNA_ORIENTATION=+
MPPSPSSNSSPGTKRFRILLWSGVAMSSLWVFFTFATLLGVTISSTASPTGTSWDEISLLPFVTKRAVTSSTSTRAGKANDPGNVSSCSHTTANHNNNSASLGVDWSDKNFQRWGWDNDPIVIESHKLLFFTVPKNSCTEWKKLFRRMMGYKNWAQASPHDPSSNQLKYLGHFPRSKQYEFMTSPEWTRAIFVRDPIERMLSGYMDKALSEERYIRNHCCNQAQMELRQRQQPKTQNSQMYYNQCKVLHSITHKDKLSPEQFLFDTFVKAFMKQCDDPHWAPQSRRMKPKNWQHINFVGHFDHLQQDARCLLERIGAWEDYGAHGWGKHNGTMFETNLARHSTGVSSSKQQKGPKEQKRHQFFETPAVNQMVLSYLQPDYNLEMLHFTKPSLI